MPTVDEEVEEVPALNDEPNLFSWRPSARPRQRPRKKGGDSMANNLLSKRCRPSDAGILFMDGEERREQWPGAPDTTVMACCLIDGLLDCDSCGNNIVCGAKGLNSNKR